MPPIVVIAALLLAGCSPKRPAAEPRPVTVVVHGIEPRGLDFAGVRGDLVLELRDAGPSSLVPRTLEWDLVLADAVVLSGRSATTPAAEPGRFTTPLEFRWDEVEPALDAIGGADTLPWTLTGSLHTVGARGDVALPLQGAGALPALAPPEPILRGLVLHDLDLRNALAAGELLFALESPQDLELLRLEHRLSVDGLLAHEGDALPERADDALALPLTLDLNPLDEVVLDALATRSPVTLRFEGTATVRTPHGELPLDIDVEELVPVRDAAAVTDELEAGAEPGVDGLDAEAEPEP